MNDLLKIKFDGKRLQEIRESKGLTQQQVADSIGVAKSTLSNYECDEGKPSADVLTRLYIFYGLVESAKVA